MLVTLSLFLYLLKPFDTKCPPSLYLFIYLYIFLSLLFLLLLFFLLVCNTCITFWRRKYFCIFRLSVLLREKDLQSKNKIHK